MKKFCPNCGELLPKNAELCPSCALPTSASPSDINDVDEIILDAHSAEKSQNSLPEANGFREELAEEAKKEKKRKGKKPSDAPTDKRYKPVGFFRYMLFIILFSIPFIGFILAIVMSFAPKNKSFKSFSRAAVVYIIFMTIIGVILSSFLGFSMLTLVVLATGGPILVSTVAGAVGLILAGQLNDIDDVIAVAIELFEQVVILAEDLFEVVVDLVELVERYNAGEFDEALEDAEKIEGIIGGNSNNDIFEQAPEAEKNEAPEISDDAMPEEDEVIFAPYIAYQS